MKEKEDIKTLKDYLPDIERYFRDDCYCLNEVYSVDGFGYRLVYADTPAKLIDEGNYNGKVLFFETLAERKDPILLNVWVEDDKVVECERYEVSKENIENIKKCLHDNTYKFKLTEADELAKETKEIFNLCNGVVISD